MEEATHQANTVATASEEMSATSNDISQNCTKVAGASDLAAATAKGGASIVNETISGMDIISERVVLTSKTIQALGVRSEQIGDIIRTIEDIADQTNLLALNAAIEAARAGEQGRGFAVVADEVRNLAVRTTKATKDISVMIQGIQKDTSEAVKVMEDGVSEVEKDVTCSHKSGQALEDILEQIYEVGMQINQIATAAEQQTATTDEVTNNIQHITDIIKKTAQESSASVHEVSQLADQARALQLLVHKFRLS
jgi:methyl-accepting chemotaxis protein